MKGVTKHPRTQKFLPSNFNKNAFFGISTLLYEFYIILANFLVILKNFVPQILFAKRHLLEVLPFYVRCTSTLPLLFSQF